LGRDHRDKRIEEAGGRNKTRPEVQDEAVSRESVIGQPEKEEIRLPSAAVEVRDHEGGGRGNRH